MKDRISSQGKEGRVRLRLDNGEVIEGVLEMADDPIEEGTPYNKGTQLSDNTAQQLGYSKSDNPTVNDAFSSLAPLYSGLGNQYMWAKGTSEFSVVPVDLIETTTVFRFNSSSTPYNLLYSESAKYADGKIELVNPKTIRFDWINYQTKPTADASIQLLKGKFIAGSENPSYIRYIPTDATISSKITAEYTTYYYFLYASQIFGVKAKYNYSILEYLNSKNKDAFFGDDIFPLGRLGQKIFFGTYVGDGRSGENEKNTLTFDFSPNMIIIMGTTGYPTIFLRNCAVAQAYSGDPYYPSKIYSEWEKMSVSWYAIKSGAGDVGSQMNEKDVVYSYAAF